MRKMKIRVAAFGALLALCMSLVACSATPDAWAIGSRSLGTPEAAAHPYLVSSAVETTPGWEFGRNGGWYADQRHIPDHPPFGGAVISVYERLGISNGRPREYARWSTYSHRGLAPR